jgi:FkbM family methyltransferase
MMLKQIAKSVANGLAPQYMYRRFLRINTLKEPEVRLLPLLCDKDKRALDVGANAGLYVHHLLPVSAAVVAFEPLSPMQDRLRRVYGERIRLEPVALSDEAGETEIRFPEGEYPLATIERDNALVAASSVKMRAQKTALRTLDSYGLDEVGFMKIDVEGHEEAVLRGAVETLKRCQPNLIIEIEERHKTGSVGKIYERLKALGYAGFFVADGAVGALETFEIARDQSVANVGLHGKTGRYINNFIFVPAGRAAAFQAAASKLTMN